MDYCKYFFQKNILVTGASGFIGGNLCNRLKEYHPNIIGVSRSRQIKNINVDKWVTGDLKDPGFTSSLLNRFKPDYIFHLASYVTGSRDIDEVQPTFHNILTSTVNILCNASKYSVKRLVIAGSLEEPGYEDEHDAVPVSPYAAAKLSCTHYAMMFYQLYETPVTIPRIFMVYGPGYQSEKRILPYLIHSLFNGKRPDVTSGRRLIDWIYIDDVINGLLSMAIEEKAIGNKIDLGTGKQLSIYDFCKKIEYKLNKLNHVNFGSKQDRKNERECQADINKSKELLGWEPLTSIDDGLEKTIQWYKKEYGY